MAQSDLNLFWASFPTPPAQGAVGDSPQDYLAKLNTLCSLTLAWPVAHPTGQLTRLQLRKLCRDSKVDVLIAYAAVMAWGGRGVDSRNYRLSLSKASRSALILILTQLRTSKASRQDDFEAMKQAAQNITGLGISFYTKLLFFLRKKADAYILDQFTAKSAKLLFGPCRVVLTTSGYPDPDTSPAAYAWFCAAAEALGSSRIQPPIWTGEVTEQAMFDVRGGTWRKYLRSIYGKAGAKKTMQPKASAPDPVGDDSLPARVARAHASAYRAGCELPGANPHISNAPPIRVHCCLIDGVIWQYAFQKESIHAEVFIPAQHIARYDALRVFLGDANDDFGDSIVGNGAKNGKTRSIKLTVRRGLNAPQNQWDEVARQAVSAMCVIFSRVCENL
jgi:hypothetical protein